MMMYTAGTVIWLFAVILGSVHAQFTITMDSDVYCGKGIDIYDREYVINARADVTTSNPNYRCVITIRSGYTDSYYQIQITQQMVDINDCGIKLNIYEGSSPGGTAVKRLSCSTKSTGILYSKYGTVTFELITPSQLYNPRNDFSIKVKAFRDPNAPDVAEGATKLPAGAIVGIVIGIVIFTAFSIMLIWCYRERRLPGMQQYRKQARPVHGGPQSHGHTNSDFNYSKEPSLCSDAPSKKFYLEDQGVFPSIDSLANNSLNGSAAGLPVKKAQIGNWNIKTGQNNDPNFRNVSGDRNRYQSESDGRGRYQKADNQGRGRTQSQGDSPSRRRRDDEKFRQNNVPPAPPIQGRLLESSNRKNDDNEMSGVKRRRQKNNQGDEETDTKRPNSGIFENPDKEGYMYDYDQVKKLSADDQDNEGNKMLHELKKELERRQSVKEGKGDNGEKQKNENKSDDPPGAPVSKKEIKQTNNKPSLPETGKMDGKYREMDLQSEIGDPDTISNPLKGSNPAIRASVSELRGSTSPGSRKKKRRKSHKKYVKADPLTGGDPNKSVDESSTDRPLDESFDRDSIYNDSFRLPNTGLTKNTPLPPEALAPVFATDESVMQHYYPPNQYDMQNQVYPVVGYDAVGNPVYGHPVPLSVAYTQPGYYVDQHGYPVNMPTQQQPMQYTPTDFHPGMPGYTSTPGNYDQTPHRKKSAHHALVASPGAPSPILPPGNILDDPRIPPPGTTLMNSGVDPRTGVKTSQVVWTDSNPDPTDPRGDNPQITRQTIVRVTARDTEDAQLPKPGGTGLQQMTFSAAKQLKHAGNTDPAFLSPSKGKMGSEAYTPKPVYASQTPERDNAAFYTRVAPPEQNQISSAPKPVVHNQARNYSVRDQITLKPEESEF
ncbi:uncharacterized protein [Mytilus edulis]|uniref:uncharacterized protein n=1 Tax=Mytilus edulis TaxID=6550 RepID=UPI0039EE1C1E